MVLLGAALAPVIHCSNWANRSIYFLLLKKQLAARPVIRRTHCSLVIEQRPEAAEPTVGQGDFNCKESSNLAYNIKRGQEAWP